MVSYFNLPTFLLASICSTQGTPVSSVGSVTVKVNVLSDIPTDQVEIFPQSEISSLFLKLLVTTKNSFKNQENSMSTMGSSFLEASVYIFHFLQFVYRVLYLLSESLKSHR